MPVTVTMGRFDSDVLRKVAWPMPVLQGFTLIELLVVLATVSAVLAILMPALGRARSAAKRAACGSNLRQIDLAIRLYAETNDQRYPCADDPVSTSPYCWLWMGRGWRSFIEPYLGGHIDANNPSVLLCPADRSDPQKWQSTSYLYSMAFYHSPRQIDDINDFRRTYSDPKPSVCQKPVNVAKPSQKIIAGEWLSNHYVIKEGADPGWWGWAGRRNYLFADGHVYFLKAEDILPANDGNPNPNLTAGGIAGIDWQP